MNAPSGPRFDPLFAPLKLGGKTAPNRFVFAAHQTNFAVHNRLTERHAAYYAARAAGGSGLIVLEASAVHPSDWPYEYAVFGHDPAVVEGYRLAAEAIHRHGALVLAQLSHSGMQGTSHYSQLPLWGPSPVPEVNSRELPQAMDAEDIAAVVEGFRQAARYALDGGLDGVELNAGQDSLIRQFLSPLTNQRGDEYGGALDNRLRFARQIMRAVREELGQDAVVGLRLSGDEYAPWAGIKPEDAAEIARLLAEDGLLDFLSVTSGSIYTGHVTRPGLYQPPGFAVHLAAGVKAAVPIPVFAQGSIVDPAMALEIVAEGKADAVEMTRALIADPELPLKLRRGDLDDIRPGLLANQDNIIGLVQNPRLSCANNPAAGYEGEPEFAPLAPARNPHRVLVIGGGPAGMEAARVAALRGHRVTLHERQQQLGGAIRLAAAAPGRERLALAADWLETQLRKLDVSVRFGSEATEERVRREAPDAVIVAVGGQPGRQPGARFDPSAPVVNPRQVLRGEVPAQPGRAVVLDTLGDPVGMGVAEWLAERGWQVEVVTGDMFVGQRLTASLELTAWNQRAAARGIAFRPQFDVLEVTENSVLGADHFDRQEIRLDGIDLVVDVSPEVPDETLYFALKASGLRVIRAGDCVAPRYLAQAILEGYRAGREA
ncbi:MAG: FAD-dependent oxidoreductase [Candidatus Competibacteraceae bacterium]|nr:FAD-dependent oxidoreductase [Candidatus Competibacteraceae bacterium]